MTGKILWIEIQESNMRMSTKDYQSLGSTAARMIRGVQFTANLISIVHEDRHDTDHTHDRQILYFGDSWFGSIKSVSEVALAGNHTCMLIKTAHSKSPIIS